MYVCMFFDTITLDFQTPRPTHPPNVRLQFRLSVNDDVTLIVDSPALGAAEIVLSQSKYMVVVIGDHVDCARQERESCHERAQHRMKLDHRHVATSAESCERFRLAEHRVALRLWFLTSAMLFSMVSFPMKWMVPLT